MVFLDRNVPEFLGAARPQHGCPFFGANGSAIIENTASQSAVKQPQQIETARIAFERRPFWVRIVCQTNQCHEAEQPFATDVMSAVTGSTANLRSIFLDRSRGGGT
jgi:hypothetical protein